MFILTSLALAAQQIPAPVAPAPPPIAQHPASSPRTPRRLKLSGTIRARYETVAGQVRPGFNGSDQLVNFRTTLLAEYDAKPLRVVAEMYDSRAYGANPRTPVSTNEVNTLELVQAYVAVDLGAVAKGGNASVQAGRFLLNLGSRRLVAADDYRNTTNSYTGLRGDLSLRGGWKATLIYTLPQVRQPDDLSAVLNNKVGPDRESFDLVLWGGVASKAKAIGPLTGEMSYFHLGERDAPARPTRNRSLDTVSVHAIADPAIGRIDGEIEAIGQRGQIAATLAPGAPMLDVAAWFLHADLGYTFAGAWRPRVSIEYDRASGDGTGAKYTRFDPLFGMRRADLAPAGLYNAVGRTNLSSPGIRVEVVPDRTIDAFVSYRPIWLADRTDSFSTTGVRDATGRSGSFAGHQIDARIRYLALSWLRLEADGVVLAKGGFLRTAPNATPRRIERYLSLNATATF